MNKIKKFIIPILIILFLNITWPRLVFSKEDNQLIKASITEHQPEMRSMPEENIPVITIKKRKLTWLEQLVSWMPKVTHRR